MKRLLLITLLLVGAVAHATSPVIVLSKSFLNQTADIPLQVIYTVPSTGSEAFRVTMYGTVCHTSTVSVGPIFTWTDLDGKHDSASPGPNGANINLNSLPNATCDPQFGRNASNVFTFLTLHGTTISFGTQTSFPPFTGSFDFYIRIEKL